MFIKYWKKFLCLVLVFALLLQIVPFNAYAEESLPSNLVCDSQTGMSALYEYTPFNIGMAGTAYVNAYLGALHLRRSDLSLGGERMPVLIEFYYDTANDFTNNPYGAGWATSYSQLLYYNEDNEQYAYKDANGTWIYFVDSGDTDDNGNEIWIEDASYGVGEVGVTLIRPSTSAYSNYVTIDLINGDTHYSFDNNGRLVAITNDVNQITISYVSGTSNSIDYITDPVGRRFCFSYTDGLLSAIQCKTAEGSVIPNTSVNYSVVNDHLTEVCFASGNVVTYEYDSSGNIVRAVNVDQCGYSMSYTSTNKVSSLTAKAAMGTDNEASGIVTQFEYPEENQTLITADGTQQKYVFDGCGRVTNCELLIASPGTATYSLNATQYQCIYGYNMVYGYVTNDEGLTIHTIVDVEVYDADGLIEDDSDEEPEDPDVTEPEATEPEETEPDNYSYTTDDYGNILTEIYTNGDLQQITSYTYSADGNYLTSQTDADGNTVQYQYNVQTGLLDSLIDANGNETEYTYNALRELQLARMDVSNLTNGDEMATNYNYANGRLVSLVYGSFQYAFAYDIWGNILTVTMNAQPLVSYNYGNDVYRGQVQTMTYGNGQSVFYAYDALGQIEAVGYTDQPNRFTYTYNADGTLSQISDSVMDEVTIYTETGYEIRSTDDQLIYAYSADNNSSTENIDGFLVQTSYSDDYRTSITTGNSSSIIAANRTYDAFNRMVEQTLSTEKLEISRYYSYQTDINGSTGNLVNNYTFIYTFSDRLKTTLDFTYTYDGNGNITGIAKNEQSGIITPIPGIGEPENPGMRLVIPGTGDFGDTDPALPKLNYSNSYSYDEAGQLVEVIDDENEKIYRYTYDASGNIQTMRIWQISDTGAEVLLQSKDFSYADGLLTGYNTGGQMTVQYELDTMGNPVRMTKTFRTPRGETQVEDTLTWGEGRMLLGISRDEDNSIAYTYNSDGLRTYQAVTEDGISTTTQYIWGNNGLAAVIYEDKKVIPLYDDAGDAIGFAVVTENADPQLAPTEEIYTYVKNLQGDVIRILDKNGTDVVSYTYDPWGVPEVYGDSDLAAINPCSYRGYYYDEETGYYYLQSRYYDPEIGRFLNIDNVEYLGANDSLQSYNLYCYCGNNAPNCIDRLGTSWIQWTSYQIAKVLSSLNYLYNRTLSFSGYIFDQTSGNASKARMGLFTGKHNGCGWIATYNALKMLSRTKHPADIIRFYETNGSLVYGALGIQPYAVAAYFKLMGYKVTITYSTAQYDAIAKKSKANIIWFWHSEGAHFVALKWNGNAFLGYNTFSGEYYPNNWGSSISKYLRKYSFSAGMLISIA